MIVNAPFTIPEPPIPETALATISIFEEVATAHKREPNSNRAKNNINVYLDMLAPA
jgi:hypothetical protein